MYRLFLQFDTSKISSKLSHSVKREESILKVSFANSTSLLLWCLLIKYRVVMGRLVYLVTFKKLGNNITEEVIY